MPAFKRANSSTHRGGISGWITAIVHNLQEEYVQSCNDLLGQKEEEEEVPVAGEPGQGEETSNMAELEVIF